LHSKNRVKNFYTSYVHRISVSKAFVLAIQYFPFKDIQIVINNFLFEYFGQKFFGFVFKTIIFLIRKL